ncbi:MAG: DoxX family protein [Candidatus Nanohaloarchaea archaeon]
MSMIARLRDSTAEARKKYSLLGIRLMMGWIFFTAGLGKLLDKDGLAFKGAAPYLAHASLQTPSFSGGIQGILQAPGLALVKVGAVIMEPVFGFMASIPFIGQLVVLSELFVGLALLFGVLTRLGAFIGAVMALMFYYGNTAFKHGLMNSDFVYLYLFVVIAVVGAGRFYGFDDRLAESEFFERYPRLKYLLG